MTDGWRSGLSARERNQRKRDLKRKGSSLKMTQLDKRIKSAGSASLAVRCLLLGHISGATRMP